MVLDLESRSATIDGQRVSLSAPIATPIVAVPQIVNPFDGTIVQPSRSVPRSIQSIQATLGGRVAPPAFIDRYQFRSGNGLTPQVIYEILSLADYGYLYRQADLFDEIRESDAHLHSVLARRESAVAGSDWSLRAPKDSGDEGTNVATYVQGVLDTMEPDPDFGLSMSDVVMHMQSGLYHGRAVLEVVWDRDGIRPLSIEQVHARRLAMADDWRLHLWDQSGSATDQYGTNSNSPFTVFPGVPLNVFPRGKFIVHKPFVRGTYPQREGLGRILVWYSCFKKFGVRDLLALAAWAGRGLRIGKYNSGKVKGHENPASDEDQVILQQMVDAMSSTVSAVIPDTTDIDIKTSVAEPKIHEAIINICNAEESKAVLGATLTTEVGSTGGNRSLGEVHQDSERKLAAMDEKSIGRTLYRDLLVPIVARKFGVKAAKYTPTIQFGTDPIESKDVLARRIQIAIQSGARVKHRWYAKQLGYETDVPEDSDAVMVPIEPSEMSEVLMPGSGMPGAPPAGAAVVAPAAAPAVDSDGHAAAESTKKPLDPAPEPTATPEGTAEYDSMKPPVPAGTKHPAEN